MPRLLRALYALLTLAFALSVVVQWNDPDPLPWMGVYGAALVLAVLAFLGRPLLWESTALAMIAGIWALTLVPSLPRLGEPAVREWSMQKGDVGAEEARECGGLLIVVGASLLILLDANARRRRSLSVPAASAPAASAPAPSAPAPSAPAQSALTAPTASLQRSA